MADSPHAPIVALTAYRAEQTPPMSLEALGAFLGVSTAAVSRWESGDRELKGKSLHDVSKKTGIPIPKLRPDLAALFAPEPEPAQ